MGMKLSKSFVSYWLNLLVISGKTPWEPHLFWRINLLTNTTRQDNKGAGVSVTGTLIDDTGCGDAKYLLQIMTPKIIIFACSNVIYFTGFFFAYTLLTTSVCLSLFTFTLIILPPPTVFSSDASFSFGFPKRTDYSMKGAPLGRTHALFGVGGRSSPASQRLKSHLVLNIGVLHFRITHV